MNDDTAAPGGLQSLDAALALLARLAGAAGPQALTDLARAEGIPASKAHRYLASFVHAGLVRQAGRSGKYDLGPAATAMGLAALSRLDFVNRTADRLPDLVAETGLTALLCVWSAGGPVVIRWERSASYMVTALGLGSTLPLLNSATGRVFLAYSPAAVTATLLARERTAATDPEAVAAKTRAAGFASVSGDLIPGLAAVAAPVLDWQGEAQASVTLIGNHPARTTAAVPALLRFCAGLGLAPSERQ